MKKFGLIFGFLFFALTCTSVFASETETKKLPNFIVKEAHEANLNRYLDYIKTKIEPNWPFNLYADEPAIIEVKISKSGELLDSKIIKSSGNPDLDDFVLQSAKNAAPFKPFPSGFKNVSYVNAQYGFVQKRKFITPNEGKQKIEEEVSD